MARTKSSGSKPRSRRKINLRPITSTTRSGSQQSVRDVVKLEIALPPNQKLIGQTSSESDPRKLGLFPFTESSKNSIGQNRDFQDPYDWSVDRQSEANIKDLVEDLNYSMDNVVSNLLHHYDMERKRLKRGPVVNRNYESPFTNRDPCAIGGFNPVYNLLRLKPYKRISNENKDAILEILLHHELCTYLDQMFFSGSVFYGIHGIALTEFENVYKTITQRNSCVDATSAARFSTRALLKRFEQLLVMVYPSNNPRYRQAVRNTVVLTIHDLVDKLLVLGQKLSFSVQHDILTSRMKVTTAPSLSGLSYERFNKNMVTGIPDSAGKLPEEGETVLGTFKFGLSAMKKENVRIVILPQVITENVMPTSFRLPI